ncbi:MAG: aminoacyl-tRNA hydrolase [Spirochaetes bacterium]|nr:aminoacyl-tRNA hydrolase [Spirochaetota bacterium]
MDYLIVGLGNPTDRYYLTRHNVGFLSIDLISDHYDIPVTKKYKKSVMGTGALSGNRIFLMKPLTYMNLSGTVIRSAFAKHRISPEKLIIIYDDIDLPLGKIRIRKDGGSAGHKGLQSILENLQNKNFIRIRIGIHSDRKGSIPTEEFVLRKFDPEEMKIITQSLKKIPGILDLLLNDSVEKAMNDFN